MASFEFLLAGFEDIDASMELDVSLLGLKRVVAEVDGRSYAIGMSERE